MRTTLNRFGVHLAAVAALIALGPERNSHAQSGALAQTLGFESPSQWQLTGGSGSLSSVTALSQGTSALQISGNGWRRVRSNAVVTGQVGTTLGIDIVLRSAAAGWETLGVVLEIPSANLHWQDLGTRSLSGWATGTLHTLTFTLPANARTALAANHQAYINVIFNGGQTFALDRLDMGLAPPPPPPPPPSSATCVTHDLEVVDVQADFRDIWAGRESVATGKRTDPFPTITLRFNKNVEVHRLAAELIGLTAKLDQTSADCIDGAGQPREAVMLHDAALSGEGGGGAWNLHLTGTAQSAPLDFNLIAFDDVTGVPDVQGALFAGGDLTLQNFSVNQTSGRPAGVVVGGRLTGTNGTIRGDLVRGTTLPVLTSVTLTGTQRSGLPIDSGQLESRLTSMSQALGGLAATGTAQLTNSQLKLQGSVSGLNVFAVPAATLSQARSIQLSVPSGAPALVNVSGSSVTVTNAGIALGATARGALLWNLPNATQLKLENVSFQGSALAPLAAASVSNGNFEGTLVAHSVTGSMEFHSYPLTAWETFGGSGLASSVTFKPRGRLRAACEYQFIINPSPATPDGSCLREPFVQSFLVSDDRKGSFDREIAARAYGSAPLPTPASFTARAGINTPVEEVFERYAAVLDLRAGIDELLPASASVASPLDPDQEIQNFRQYYKGIPLLGYGYLAHHEGGLFRSARGKVARGLALSTTPAISAQQAISAALAAVNPAVRPWQQNPPTGAPPSAELVFRPIGYDPSAPSLRLVFRVRFSGIREAHYADVDAANGVVLYTQPLALGVTECAAFDPSAASLTRHETRDITIAFDNSTIRNRDDLTIGIWTQGSTVHSAYANAEPFLHRSSFMRQGPGGPEDLVATEYVCESIDVETVKVAAAHWAVQHAERTFYDVLDWEGLRGPGAGGGILVTVSDVPQDHPFMYTSFTPGADLSKADEITLRLPEVFPGAAAHEFGHGVSLYSRLAIGTGQRENVGESGSLDEAYGDVMAALALHRAVPNTTRDPFCVSVLGQGCDRNLANPQASVERPHPDTYGGFDYEPLEPPCEEENGYCWTHKNSTIASHWFYKLTKGDAGTQPNDNGCAVRVAPLDTDFSASIADAAKIVFEGFRLIEPSDGFLAARAATEDVADAFFGPEARLSVEQAWHAVGVGGAPRPPTILPEDGATDVEPWTTGFRVAVADDDDGPWMLRYSKEWDLADPITVPMSIVEIGGVRYARVSEALAVDTTYYWQAVRGDDPTDETLWACNAFRASFTTSGKPIHVRTPAALTRGAYYQTNNMGHFAWEWVPGVLNYQALLRETDDGCERPASEWTDVPISFDRTYPEVFLGDTIDQNVILDRNPIKLRPDLLFEDNRTYHLYVRAMNSSGPGTCNHFLVRKTMLLPFQKISPLNFVTIPYESGGPFVWTPSQGAESYRITIGRYPPDGPFETILRETIDPGELVVNAEGNLEYTLGDRDATTLPGQIKWEVEAVHANGDRRSAWDPGAAELSTDAWFWNAAAQIFSAHSDQGEHGPMVDDLFVPVTLVFPNQQTDRDTQTCFEIPANTIGLWWWFGPQIAVPTEDQFVKVPVPPGTDEVCTTRLDLSDDEPKMLVVYPYSNFKFGNPQGTFGPPTVFYMSVSSCGGVGDACCTPGDTCVEGALCDVNTCISCGGTDEFCCDGECDFSDLECDGGRCRDCGAPGEMCCSNDNGTRFCWPDAVCVGRDCMACGGHGERCCRNDTCDAGGTCNLETHRCETLEKCNRPVGAAGGNEPETHTIHMGKVQGKATLTFNTYNIADSISVFYEGQRVAFVDCFRTLNVEGLQKVYDPHGSSEDQFADCNGDECKLPFSYGPGSSGNLQVVVDPNCQHTPDTVWDFTLSCPE